MAYERQYYTNGDVLNAEQLNHMEAGIKENSDNVSKLSEDIADIKQNGTGTGNGLTTAQRNSLLAVVNAIGTFNVANGQELIDNFNSAWKITINATGVTLDKTTLTFVESVNQTLVATVEPSDSTDEVMWVSSNESIAKVTNGIVTPISNGSCIITVTAGSVSASCEVTVNVETAIVTYTVVNNLTNVSTDNPVGTITENSGYTAILTPDTDYEFDTVVVTMGGVDVTSDVYANGVIVITSVTGNVVITANAVKNGSTEEVVFLKSITGDGASYIDTEIMLKTLGIDQLFEFSAKIDNWNKDNEYNVFGADRFAVGGSYGRETIAFRGNQLYENISGKHGATLVPRVQDTDGIWNVGATPTLRIERQWYKCAITTEGALSVTYLDEDMTQLPTSGEANFTAWDNYDESKILEELPIVPAYLFAINLDGTITPSTITLYEFKIKKYSTGEMLHEFLPAKQGSKIGMYDTVTQKFHENKGAGTFAYEELEVA